MDLGVGISERLDLLIAYRKRETFVGRQDRRTIRSELCKKRGGGQFIYQKSLEGFLEGREGVGDLELGCVAI